MSFGFGCGDIVLLLTAIKKGIDRYQEAPELVKDAVRNVKAMHMNLTYVEKKYPLSEGEFIKAYGQNVADVLQELFADLKPVLKDLRLLIQKWNKQSKSKALQVTFIISGYSDMKSLQAEVKTMFDRVQSILNVLAVGDVMTLRKLAEAEKAREEKERKLAAAARKRDDKKIIGLLQQLLDEKGEQNISHAATSSDGSKWEKLEKEVQARGFSSDEAHKLLQPMKVEILRTSVASKPKTLPVPSYVMKRSRSPSPSPQSGEQVLPTIFVVDRTNGIRSNAAQFYLELVRAWGNNTTSKCIFTHVTSAGTNVQSHFSTDIVKVPAWVKSGEAVKTEWVTALAGGRTYFQTEDEPHEKEKLLAKMQSRKRGGIDMFHFRTSSHILCFDHQTYDLLVKMKPKALQQISKLPTSTLTKSTPIEPTIYLLAAQKTFKDPAVELVEEVKKLIKTFLETQFKWTRPPNNVGIARGKYRTTLFWVKPETAHRARKQRRAEVKALEKKEGVRVLMSPYDVPDEQVNGKLISVVSKAGNFAFVDQLKTIMGVEDFADDSADA